MNKSFLHFVVLFVAFSFVLSSIAAVPASRSLKSIKDSTVQDVDAQEKAGGGEILVVERFIEGRMDFESTDYPGTGANNHHDPRTPGRI